MVSAASLVLITCIAAQLSRAGNFLDFLESEGAAYITGDLVLRGAILDSTVPHADPDGA